MEKGILELLSDRLCGGSRIGYLGETLIAWKLKFMSVFGYKGKILRNVYIPKNDDDTSEIDVIYITEKGVFVIESKNYSGWIFGREDDLFWTASLPNKIKNRFYNPMKQNHSHIQWLQQYLSDKIPLFSVVVFSERCELKKLQINSSDIVVVKRGDMSAAITSVWKKQPSVLDDATVRNIYDKLCPLTHQSKEAKQTHIDNIQKKYSSLQSGKKSSVLGRNGQSTVLQAAAETVTDKSEQPAVPQNASETDLQKSDTAIMIPDVTVPSDESVPTVQKDGDMPRNDTAAAAKPEPTKPDSQNNGLICPRCGAKLVLHTAKRGKYVGKAFYGCSRYPHCHYIRNL